MIKLAKFWLIWEPELKSDCHQNLRSEISWIMTSPNSESRITYTRHPVQCLISMRVSQAMSWFSVSKSVLFPQTNSHNHRHTTSPTSPSSQLHITPTSVTLICKASCNNVHNPENTFKGVRRLANVIERYVCACVRACVHMYVYGGEVGVGGSVHKSMFKEKQNC